MRIRTRVSLFVIVGFCIVLASTAKAQEFGEIGAAFKDSLDALRGYSWNSTVEFYLDGELKSTKTYEVTYSADGRVERKLIDEERKGKASKHERAAETQLSGIRTMIDGYTHMDPENFRAAFGENYREVLPADNGLTRVNTTHFLSRGDSASVWVDSRTYRMRKMKFDTAQMGQPTHVIAEFQDVEGGATWLLSSTLSTHDKKKGKAMRLVTKNSEPTPPTR
jgi:outer membrane lipoprotein-sorting protein